MKKSVDKNTGKIVMTEIVLAFGSNLGDREQNLNRAVERLRDQIIIKKNSTWYETSPIEMSGSAPNFFNGAVIGETALSAEELLTFCQSVEREFGRMPRPRFLARGLSRTLDVDIIFFGDQIIESAILQIPHPRFAERSFVLEPLNEIAPERICPRSRLTVAQLWKNRQAADLPIKQG